MSVTVKNIIARKQAETVQTGQYTADNCRAIIDKFTATNTSTSNVAFSVNLVPLSGTAGDGNLVLKARVLAPGETYLCPELVGQVLESGGVISTLAEAAASITISASGREIT